MDDHVTQLLIQAREAGRPADELLAEVYERLKAFAIRRIQGEAPGHTLQPTALVHEAYLKLVDQDRVDWQGRTHFFAVAAGAMRRILIDHARGRNAVKRGALWDRVTLDPGSPNAGDACADILELDEVLQQLSQLHPRQARIVELKFFAGMTNEEIAGTLDISRTTVAADWTVARAWLARALGSA